MIILPTRPQHTKYYQVRCAKWVPFPLLRPFSSRPHVRFSSGPLQVTHIDRQQMPQSLLQIIIYTQQTTTQATILKESEANSLNSLKRAQNEHMAADGAR